MAVLTFPGAEAVLAAQSAALPQPDQLCGPFSALVALHAVLAPTDVPTLGEIAMASGSAIWPHDMAAWRPAGATGDRSSWTGLPRAPSAEASGTDADGLAGGVAAATDGSVVAVPVSGAGAAADALAGLLLAITAADVRVGVVANLSTGALDPGAGWDVGHFVVLWAVDVDHPDGVRVAVADTYRELGAPGQPPGCRWVTIASLTAASPGRGLLLLVRSESALAVRDLVATAGLDSMIWCT
jgi:hypothetical protein